MATKLVVKLSWKYTFTLELLSRRLDFAWRDLDSNVDTAAFNLDGTSGAFRDDADQNFLDLAFLSQ